MQCIFFRGTIRMIPKSSWVRPAANRQRRGPANSFVAFVLGCLMVLAASSANCVQAEIIYSGVKNIALDTPTFSADNDYGVAFIPGNSQDQITFDNNETPFALTLYVEGNGVGSPLIDSSGNPQALSAGTTIGSGSSGTFGNASTQYAMVTYPSVSGNWANVQNGYLGVSFTENSLTYYGWIELSVTHQPNNLQATIQGWAYQNTAGKSIAAGDTGIASVPEPSSLVLAGLGGLGLLGAAARNRWRRRLVLASRS